MSKDFEVGSGGICELCGRTVSRLTKHHLIPRTRHKNKKNKKNFDRVEVKERVAWLCRPCHSNVHVVVDNKDLEYNFNTLELLASHPEVIKFTNWIKKKPHGTVTPAHKDNLSH